MEVLRLLITISMSKMENPGWKRRFVANHDYAVKINNFKMANSIGRRLLTKFEVFFFKLHKNAYERVFEVADHGFGVDV